MIDVSDDHALSKLLPESIATEDDVVAMALALDPQFKEVAVAIASAIVMPDLDHAEEWVLDAVAWSMRLDELALWDDAPIAGKRDLLRGVLAFRKKSGTRMAVRRMCALLRVSGKVIEWWEESAAAYTYRLRFIVDSDGGLTLHTLQQVPELTHRFAPTRSQMTQFAVEIEGRATTGTPNLVPVLSVGRLVEIPFGGP